jgi:hypothetical protein
VYDTLFTSVPVPPILVLGGGTSSDVAGRALEGIGNLMSRWAIPYTIRARDHLGT